ncbi:MAG: sugar ABC transporter permease [Caldilineae bacterium]|nr:MAG: sugar ABC transporter permease [Caldilineae bacterium]
MFVLCVSVKLTSLDDEDARRLTLTPVTTPVQEVGRTRRRIRWMDVQEQLTGYLFILPAMIVISVFGLFPIFYAIYMSTFKWRVRKGSFVGLGNYAKAVGDLSGVVTFLVGFGLIALAYVVWRWALRSSDTRKLLGGAAGALVLIAAGWVIATGWGKMMMSGDENFLQALPVTVYYALGTVPAEIGLALILAALLYQKIRGQEFFRMLYFLPYVTPAVAAAVVFRTIFNPRDTSLANQILSWFGIAAKKWLFEPEPFINAMFGTDFHGFLAGPSMALVSIIFFGIWTYVGYNTVIFLAGLGSIPHELYEAAEIDGASKWQSFRHVTLPLLSPVTFYLALIAFIGTFKAFNHIYVMRSPSALGTADTTSVVIFDTFYKANQYGYAAAQAIILFLIILALTMVQNRVFGEKVFYG